jgi:hypothetical protein
MAALQIHAEYGPNLPWADEEAVHTALERFITPQVITMRSREDWVKDVGQRCAWAWCACTWSRGSVQRGADTGEGLLACPGPRPRGAGP